MNLRWTEPKKLRVLDFDSESRPLSFWYEGKTTNQITAIAASWFGEKKVHVWLLGQHHPVEILQGFSSLYREADVVSAHNVRGFDLPLIQGALAELDLPLLGPKLASDTLKDIPRWRDLPKSQENLCEMMGIPAEKKHMSQISWREANKLTDEGVRKTKQRVVKDVIQHKLLREELIRRGWLGAPRMWNG